MKTASQSVQKWQNRAGAAVSDYEAGATSTTKDQAALAASAKVSWFQGITQANSKDLFAKGLQRSGKQGWLDGIREKGVNNFSTGVSAPKSANKYVENSGRFDSARAAVAGTQKGPRGSEGNYARSATVAKALRLAKVGS